MEGRIAMSNKELHRRVWIPGYKELLDRLNQMTLISREVRQYIRDHGICSSTGDEVEMLLEKAMELSDFNEQACEYAGMLIDFCKEQSTSIPEGRVWIGSSEILESLFGKLKSLEQDQSKGGFTALVLGAAACVGKIDAEIVGMAMKQVSVADVNAWERQHIGQTMLSKKRMALGSWRRKKKIKKTIKQNQVGILLEDAMGFY